MVRSILGIVLVTTAPPSVWSILPPIVFALAAIYLLLPRPKAFPRWMGIVTSGMALLLTGLCVIHQRMAGAEAVLFLMFSLIAIVAGGLLVTQRNPVRAALSFALVVLSTCGLFLLQAAPFLMAATIIVYAGAIIVTFLFVIMLAQQAGLSDADQRTREPELSCVAGFVLLGALLYVLHMSYAAQGAATVSVSDFDAPLARVRQAAQQDLPAAMGNELGTEADTVFEDLARLAAVARGASGSRELADEVRRVRVDWPIWRAAGRAAEMQAALNRLGEKAGRVRSSHDEQGRARLPAANVAALGLTLFTEYLVAVELAGTLLLVAAIGAIAIATRRAEDLR